MSDIDLVQLRRLDMTQLLVFAELMRHRKLTIVATRLGLTQSAISHVLRRLRETFGDELFLRRPTGVEPTARAVALEPRITTILGLSSEALNLERRFDPRTEERIIRIGTADFEVAIVTSPLIEAFRAEAPGMRLSFRSATRQVAKDLMADGSIDLAIGFFGQIEEAFEEQRLFEEGYAVIARSGHPAATAMTLDAYCACEHLLVSLAGDLSGIVDQTLTRLGRSRRVIAAVPLFFPALATVAETDLIATIPRRLADRYAKRFDLVVLPPPLDIRPFTVSAVWHRRTSSDLALAYVRERLGALQL